MKKQTFWTILVGAFLGLNVLAWALYFVRPAEKAVKQKVSVILCNSTDSRWVSFTAGLKEAASSADVDLNIVATEGLTTAESAAMAEKEISSGAAGLIVELCEDLSEEEILALYRNVMIEVVDSGEYRSVDSRMLGSIGIDEAEAGTRLCSFIDHGSRVGIICGHQQKKSIMAREDALQEACRAAGNEVVWTMQDGDLDYFQESAHADVIVALSNEALEKAVDYKLSDQDDALLVGYGCSRKNTYYLDQGLIETLLVPDEFLMGYQALLDLTERMSDPGANPVSRQVGLFAVDQENMYTADMETLLFPIVR